MERFDVIIIGSGSAGYVSAIRLADLGKRVALVEEKEIGGTCLNRGCIPTKTLLRAAYLYELAKKSEPFGIRCEVSYNFDAIQKRKREVVGRLTKGVEFLLGARGVRVEEGRGKILDEKRVKISGGEVLGTDSIIIATGSEPASLPKIDIDGERIITSNEALDLKKPPESLLIIGAGAIGIEFATFFSTFGTKVTIVEMMEDILPEMKDKKIVSILERNLKKKGIDIRTGTKVEGISGESIESEKVLVSVGRRLNSDGIGIEGLGIKRERDRIIVDRRMRTNIKNIYAIGDVTGGMLLAHKAQEEGIVAAEVIAGIDREMDYRVIPWAVFSHPEVAAVGLSEDDAKKEGIETIIGEFPFLANGKAVSMGETEGMVKIVGDKKTGEVIGAQIIGAEASIMISELALAMKNRLKIKDVTNTIHTHPTLSEAVMESCKGALGEAIHRI